MESKHNLNLADVLEVSNLSMSLGMAIMQPYRNVSNFIIQTSTDSKGVFDGKEIPGVTFKISLEAEGKEMDFMGRRAFFALVPVKGTANQTYALINEHDGAEGFQSVDSYYAYETDADVNGLTRHAAIENIIDFLINGVLPRGAFKTTITYPSKESNDPA
jgi:hypothetical protein